MPKMSKRPQPMPIKDRRILAAGSRFSLDADVAWSRVEGEGDGSAPKVRRFSGTAYTGGSLQVGLYYYPVVLDLTGISARAATIPSFLGHDPQAIVGHCDDIAITAKTIKISGAMSGAGAAKQEVADSADNGFPWKMSVGVYPTNVEFVEAKATAKANGKTFTGPCNIVRAGTLEEVSFVSIAADAGTSAKVAATAQTTRSFAMFEQWVQAEFGLDAATLTEDQRAKLQARYDAEHAEPETPAAPATPATVVPPVDAGGTPPAGDHTAEYRAAQAAETDRVARIRTICAGSHPEIEAQSIREGWTGEKAELAVMRASRPTGPAIHAAGGPLEANVIEAGLLMALQHPEPAMVRAFGEQTLQRAGRFRRMGFKELVDVCCAMEGRQVCGIGASDSDRIRAGFSTVSLPGILSNVANKVMMTAYAAVPAVAKLLCRPLTASDFKTHTGYRLSGDFKFEEVAPDGELKHGKLDESAFTYSVKTYGKMFGLTRVMLINDDLGAFAEIPRMIGRGSALMEERLFWTLVLANTGNFFHANNANLITKVLGSEGLGLACKALEEQVDDQGDPILVTGRYLVVPPALHTAADELYQSTNVNTGGAATKEKVPNKNIYAGRYAPVASPYIGAASFHANASSTQFYLWGDPADVAAFGFASLDGQGAPIIEEVPLSGEFLGQAWRGYRDVGVCQIDPHGAVKSTGLVA
jgi:hypothetical protein